MWNYNKDREQPLPIYYLASLWKKEQMEINDNVYYSMGEQEKDQMEIKRSIWHRVQNDHYDIL